MRYSEYEWKAAEDGTLFLTPTATAQPSIYDPLSEYQRIVLDAINIGRMESQKKTPQEIQKAIQQFAVKYGLLGLMTALPTTPSFMDYEAVYLPKNHFIREESMSTMDYLNLFFPFDKPDVVKRGVESMWNISNDRVMMALAMTMTDKPIRICKHCLQTFVASRPSAIFCSPQCKNKYNVYKSRANKNGSADSE